jgi:hypothetical protein
MSRASISLAADESMAPMKQARVRFMTAYFQLFCGPLPQDEVKVTYVPLIEFIKKNSQITIMDQSLNLALMAMC